MSQTEARLTRLEENLCFVEAEMKSLGEMVAEQQRQMEAMSRELRLMQQRLLEILAALDDGQRPAELPPHHISGLW